MTKPDAHTKLVLRQPGSGDTVPHSAALNITDAITVEAWVDVREARAEAMQDIVSKWSPLESFDTFDAYDAGHTSGMDTTGFFGAVFDGRFVYFVPQHDTLTRHGKVLRYDTHGELKNSASWQAYDAGNTDGFVTRGFYGAVFDGRFVFFVPRRAPTEFHTRVLRLDTRGEFTDPKSWSAYDKGMARSYQSAAFDGRYIYFSPGHATIPKVAGQPPPKSASPAVTGLTGNVWQIGNSIVLRHDTRGEFKSHASWSTFDAAGTDGLECCDYDGAVFDGRYVYFVPLSTKVVLRFDTRGEFEDNRSWSAHDIGSLGMKLAVGAVFDGRYVYLVPYGETGVAIRYDTRGTFKDDRSWQAYRLADTHGLPTTGFDGGLFDGRFIYFIAYFDNKSFFHGWMLRYDTQGDFLDPKNWRAVDAGHTNGLKTVGFNGAAFDGRYIYCAPWNDGSAYPKGIVGNGRVLRYDTLGRSGSFSLRFCDYGHNGGLCAALPGARFLVNTEQGVRSIAANCAPTPGHHYLAGTYDGKTMRLFVDGALVNEQPAPGRLITNNVPLSIGRLEGHIEQVRISDCARSADWIRHQTGFPV